MRPSLEPSPLLAQTPAANDQVTNVKPLSYPLLGEPPSPTHTNLLCPTTHLMHRIPARSSLSVAVLELSTGGRWFQLFSVRPAAYVTPRSRRHVEMHCIHALWQ